MDAPRRRGQKRMTSQDFSPARVYGLLAFLFLLGWAGTAQAVGGARNYDECIILNMPGTTSDVAARAIEQSCRNLFQPSRGGIVPGTPAPQPGQLPGRVSNPTQQPTVSPTPAPPSLRKILRTDQRRIRIAPHFSIRDRGSFQSVALFLRNDNDDWQVRELTFEIENAPAGAREFETVTIVNILPLSSAEVVIDVPLGDLSAARFKIVGGRGYRF